MDVICSTLGEFGEQVGQLDFNCQQTLSVKTICTSTLFKECWGSYTFMHAACETHKNSGYTQCVCLAHS